MARRQSEIFTELPLKSSIKPIESIWFLQKCQAIPKTIFVLHSMNFLSIINYRFAQLFEGTTICETAGHRMQPMQYKLKSLPWVLSSSGCSWQLTHSLCVVMIWHRSQEHQNVPSTGSFTPSFSRSLSSGLGTRSGSKRLGWRSAVTSSQQIRFPKIKSLGKVMSCLAA